MIPLSYIFIGILTATLIPAYLALYLISSLRSGSSRYLAAAGVGLAFWYFYDTMGDANSLAENNSVYPPSLFGGVPHLALIGAFVSGVATLAVFDYFAVSSRASQASRSTNVSRYYFLIPMAIAAVMGIHGLGEGWDAASAVAGATSASPTILGSLIDAFGTLPAVLSYPLHKFLEASVVGVAYACYVSTSSGSAERRWWDLPLLGLIFGGPSVMGALIGYYVGMDTTYFFAFGVTASIYAAFRLVEAAREGFSAAAPSKLGPKIFLAMAVGFLLLYSAALLH